MHPNSSTSSTLVKETFTNSLSIFQSWSENIPLSFNQRSNAITLHLAISHHHPQLEPNDPLTSIATIHYNKDIFVYLDESFTATLWKGMDSLIPDSTMIQRSVTSSFPLLHGALVLPHLEYRVKLAHLISSGRSRLLRNCRDLQHVWSRDSRVSVMFKDFENSIRLCGDFILKSWNNISACNGIF